jgi:hypothetical protein
MLIQPHGLLILSYYSVLSDIYIGILDNVISARRGKNRVEDLAASLPSDEKSRHTVAGWYRAITRQTKKKAIVEALESLGITYDKESKDLKYFKRHLMKVPGLPFTKDPACAPSLNPFDVNNLGKREQAVIKLKESIGDAVKASKDDVPVSVPRFVLCPF